MFHGYSSDASASPSSTPSATPDSRDARHPATLADALERRDVGRFRETPAVRVVRAAVRQLCRVAPSAAAHLAFGLLARPPRYAERALQTALRGKADTTRLRFGTGEIAAFSWGAGPIVLMVHGWGARATHMGKLVEPLVNAGFRVVAFDAPAHGESSGHMTDPHQFAAAVAAVGRQFGPVHTLLTHSFGGAMALYARRDWGLEVQAQVLISSLDHCNWVTEAFAAYLGVTDRVMERARQMMVERYNGRFDWDSLSVVEMLRRTRPTPTLLVHDQADGEVPFQHSLSLLQAAPDAQFFATRGFGHHRLLGSPDVIDRVVHFVSGVGAAGLVSNRRTVSPGARELLRVSEDWLVPDARSLLN